MASRIFLECPIWTVDQDFFGVGIATWTSRTVELYFRS
ncbi:PIN domain-containing protein [Enteractinococcus helveticum]